MARTIGSKNIKEVKRLVREAESKGIQHVRQVTAYVIAHLSDAVFDTWEMAYQEVEGICWDAVMSENAVQIKWR